MPIRWEQQYAQRVQGMKSSAIRELLKVTEQADTISFAGGLPAPEVFPIEQIAKAAQEVLQTRGSQALQYSATEGYYPLREWAAQQMVKRGVQASVDNILITTGSQQALDLLGKVLMNPGDKMLVEAPTYMGALQAWSCYNIDYVSQPSDDKGIIIEGLEKILQTQPKCMYILPTFQNPTGVTLTLERRKKLVELTQQYNIPVIEDDPYSQLNFEDEPVPPLITLAESEAEQNADGYQGNIIYLCTFSKVLAPGLRLGWIVAPAALISKLVQAKQGADLHTSTFDQFIAYKLVSDGLLEEHTPYICDTYRARRDLMLALMDEHFPPGINWTRPKGGMFLWVTLPEGMNSMDILKDAVEQKIIFVPGTSFYPYGEVKNTLRLNFSNASPGQIEQGIARLGRVLRKAIGKG
ncbi:PLP-dependent aminotransferase family protein [Ktedonosporobacter rubrisoli]|uniref:PLP-dependent aminotransferase family protein n=1 Tax=Ktedonosporobacter rubrisoli TaxID=2509675 RepID=A0A4P6JRZ7_KTERU|nr:PLP-dependent aminotransferase family protein [Ktedonosporobacter rubrisoli]QBD77980.1 PLP-dependent aminotransferase family protein [Ktedonosporobacter rubrisoli]